MIVLDKIKQFSWFKNKSFWIILFLTIFFWVYISFSDTYITMLEIPITVVPPKGRAIEQELNNFINVEIEGSGWNLFNYMYINKGKKCIVHLDNIERNKEDTASYILNSVDFQKGLENINKVIPRKFYPARLNITTDRIVEKKVDIKPDVMLKVKEGFILVGGVRTEPSTVVISGNSKSLKNINQWKTTYNEFKNINASFNYILDVSDHLASIINVEPNKIKINGEIQQYAEITFDDIELKIIGGQIPNNHILLPHNFKVTLIGGIELLNKITHADIELTIDYDKIMNDTTGILVPNLKIPPFTKTMDISPKVIYHKVKSSKPIKNKLQANT
ncbi:MAG: hypothetical protein FWG85_05755 [Bacteroidetes bacterium]|nr:hypothetical protein [Bacteroidota bacterium]